MGDKIRFGIIGGGMAGPLNAGALRDIPEAEVVAFCDVKEDVAKEFSKEYNIPSYYTDSIDIISFQHLFIIRVIRRNIVLFAEFLCHILFHVTECNNLCFRDIPKCSCI